MENILKKKVIGAIGAVVVAALLSGSGVAHAAAPELPGDPDTTTTVELPANMTDTELQSLLTANDNTLNFASTAGISARAGGDYCLIFPGNMWSRVSGNIYKYGTVGSKPRLGNCTGGVVKTKLESYVYKRNGGGWTQVAGPFLSYGTGNMEQKSVQYVCKGKGTNTFQVISVGTGTNSRGQSAVGTDSTGSFSLNCK